MAIRALDIKLISADDLDDVNLFSKIKAYAVVWIEGSQSHEKKNSHVDKQNGRNPRWNYTTTFMVEEATLQQGSLVLQVEIRTKATSIDKKMGRMSIVLKDLVKPVEAGGLMAGAVECVSYQVRNRKGKPTGMLKFSAKIGKRTAPPMGCAFPYLWGPSSSYPPPQPPPHGSWSRPPPPYGGPYPLPPHASWSRPPPPHGGPYPPPQYQGVGYPPQGYPIPSQGYLPQYQPCSLVESMLTKLGAYILIEAFMGFNDGGGSVL